MRDMAQLYKKTPAPIIVRAKKIAGLLFNNTALRRRLPRRLLLTYTAEAALLAAAGPIPAAVPAGGVVAEAPGRLAGT